MEKNSLKKIAVLGSTGSIGLQTLQVINDFPDEFQVEVLSANSNYGLLIEQSKKFKPNAVVIANEEFYKQVDKELWNYGIKVYCGEKALEQIVELNEIDYVLNALLGFSALKPLVAAINAGKTIALANKEALVVAGENIIKLAADKKVPILPVDSELSAIFQACVGEYSNKIEKVYLTASGGPFLNYGLGELSKVELKDALRHPTYSMGDKISIDSASMMNKGFELIEAKHLFQLEPSQMEILVHPQSVVHSIVQFTDGSMKAQMGLPNMKSHIAYALSYPKRLQLNEKRLDFVDYPSLAFDKPKLQQFPNIKLAYHVLNAGGSTGCILNAANEVGNLAFRTGKISFDRIHKLNELALSEIDSVENPSWDDYIEIDHQVRIWAEEKLKSL